MIRLSVRLAIDLRAPERDRREGRRNGKAGSNHGQARIGWISHRRSSSLFDADRRRPGQPHRMVGRALDQRPHSKSYQRSVAAMVIELAAFANSRLLYVGSVSQIRPNIQYIEMFQWVHQNTCRWRRNVFRRVGGGWKEPKVAWSRNGTQRLAELQEG